MGFLKETKNSTYFLLGGGLLALGLGTVAYVLKNQKKEESVEGVALDRSTVIKVLKELRKEMYTVFTNFSMVSMQIKQQTQGKARPEEVKAMLLEQPMFRGEIVSVEDGVYEKYGVSRDHFQHICETQFSQDPEIRSIQQDMKDSFDKSFSGIAPDSKVDIPVFLTPVLTFQILERVMVESALKLNQRLLEFKETGEEVSFNNPKLMQVIQSLKMDGSKKEILAEYGLDKYEESAQKILQYTTQQYTIANKDNFADKMGKLDMKYQKMMEHLLSTGPMTEVQLRQIMCADVQQTTPFAGMGGFRNQHVEVEQAIIIQTPQIAVQQQIEEKAQAVVEEIVIAEQKVEEKIVEVAEEVIDAVKEIVEEPNHVAVEQEQIKINHEIIQEVDDLHVEHQHDENQPI